MVLLDSCFLANKGFNFVGVEKHLDYLKELNAKTVLVTDAASPNDQMAVVDSAGLKPMIDAIHNKGKMYIFITNKKDFELTLLVLLQV